MTLRIDPIAEARRHWEARWGAEPGRAMAAITSIVRAQQLLLARYDELLKPFGITFARYEALMLLLFTRSGELPVGKIGERLQVHRSSVTNAVDKLAGDGLVERVPHPTDGRTTLIRITDAGRDVATRATEVLNAEDFAVGALSVEEREALTRVLTTLRADAGDFAA
ncbi:MarR family winged helix-turn-helix transcriptional regulator [Paraconexibacter algicola]|nr:MarR family transcriptional regulator [Paraconexibacter algicola]